MCCALGEKRENFCVIVLHASPSHQWPSFFTKNKRVSQWFQTFSYRNFSSAHTFLNSFRLKCVKHVSEKCWKGSNNMFERIWNPCFIASGALKLCCRWGLQCHSWFFLLCKGILTTKKNKTKQKLWHVWTSIRIEEVKKCICLNCQILHVDKFVCSCLYVYNMLLYGVFPELKTHENRKYCGLMAQKALFNGK